MATAKKPKYDKFHQEPAKDHHQILTDRILEKMKEGATYQRPWFENTTERPYNPESGTVYSGVNFLTLLLANYPDPRFYTYKQITDLAERTGEDIHLRKGEKGIAIFKAFQQTFTKTDKETGEESKFGLWRQMYMGTVFNATQIDGIPPLVKREKPEGEVSEDLNKIVEAMSVTTGLKLNHHHQGRAYYNIDEDSINLPHIEHFKSVSLYQRTLGHELGHSTGHSKRLGRKLSNGFGSEEYAFEELIAELATYFLGAELGFKYDAATHENHAGYLNSWIKALENDKSLIFKAAAAASKAVEFQMDTKKLHFGEYSEAELAERDKKRQEVTTVPDTEDKKPKMKMVK